MDRPRRDGDLLVHVRRGAIGAVAMLALAAALTTLVATDPAVPPILGTVDAGWRRIVRPPPPGFEAISRWLYALGSGVVMIPVRVAVALWLAARRRYVDLAAWLLGWAAADLATQLLKPAIGRVRPDLTDATSFPSGHAKSAAQVAVGSVLLLPFGRRAWAWSLTGLWVAAMALSRTILDDHWASDVIAGALIGAGCAMGAAAFCQWRRDRRRSGDPEETET
jgi:undecaprenyl-diphosphatase